MKFFIKSRQNPRGRWVPSGAHKRFPKLHVQTRGSDLGYNPPRGYVASGPRVKMIRRMQRSGLTPTQIANILKYR